MRTLPLAAIVLLALLLAGCPRPQPGACKKYVACQAAYDSASRETPKATAAYAADGACWKDDSHAALCTQECNEMNAALAAAADAHGFKVPECR